MLLFGTLLSGRGHRARESDISRNPVAVVLTESEISTQEGSHSDRVMKWELLNLGWDFNFIGHAPRDLLTMQSCFG